MDFRGQPEMRSAKYVRRQTLRYHGSAHNRAREWTHRVKPGGTAGFILSQQKLGQVSFLSRKEHIYGNPLQNLFK